MVVVSSKGFEVASQTLTSLFLFFLVMGMASTVDIRDMKNQLTNKKKAICVGLFCQVREQLVSPQTMPLV